MAATSAAAINIKTSLYFRLIAREEEVNKARGVRGGEAGGVLPGVCQVNAWFLLVNTPGLHSDVTTAQANARQKSVR